MKATEPRADQEGVRQLVLVEGLGAEQVDERLRSACRLADVGHRAVAFYLADMHERGLHAAFGLPSVIAYAVRSLGP
ncbi:MAG: hypothetical protein HZB39_06275 [Planctomycetes bacterium]|nr:hypothetical protein [Planctomycetota bacterium]